MIDNGRLNIKRLRARARNQELRKADPYNVGQSNQEFVRQRASSPAAFVQHL